MYRYQQYHIGSLFDEHGTRLAELYYAAAQELLQVQWFGNITSREVVFVAQQFLEAQHRMSVSLLLNDKTNATGDWAECMEWLEFDWLPQALSNGLRAVAYVFSPDASSHYASRKFSERVASYLPIKLFFDVPSAYKWLCDYAHFNPNPGRGFAAQA
ncbi:hypothetical protein HMJ29_12325 [Hymenobacter taeanensis]|uniref:STAS/SEC14 domain-containing protein n=1 Tax=Hymenobacter taeanensis TaxID=2735321 RepID=A0A6M6BK33_9BACT|nr:MULTISPECIES: hypothetical protein [Hymenobacter]QJX47683.1 hypothetical protein HMJ29_12325 [Hymenobacter taeanensis]UOQ82833.1 hypothetical protein MUN83_08750 [Hymenobacter sp. 5414T-23]